MDRHDFVTKLIDMRDETKERVETLEAEITKAKTRTLEYVTEKFGEKKKCVSASDVCIAAGGGGQWVQQNVGGLSFVGNDREIKLEKIAVDDDSIIELCYEIKTLRQKVESLKKELEELRGRDFIAYVNENL